jgi:hypothetical protein
VDFFSVAGGWLGTYYFDDGDEPCRFEATFYESDREGGFRGRILDDGELGEANAEGEQVALTVSFTKAYVRPPDGRGSYPIYYRGEMSEDGKRIAGDWRLDWHEHGHRFTRAGTWEARRLWFEAVEEDVRAESEGLLVGAR